MKTLYLFLGLAALLYTAAACNPSAKFPEQRPAGFTIEYTDGGGMVPESENIFISADSAWYERWHGQVTNRTPLFFTPQQLDDLYKKLIEAKAFSIETRNEGEVYDRGGINLRFAWDQHLYTIDNSGSQFIQEKWMNNYNAVINAIWGLVKPELDKKKIRVPVHIELVPDTLPLKYFSLNLSGQPVFSWDEKKDSAFSRIDAEALLLPGNHSVQCQGKADTIYLNIHRQAALKAGDSVNLVITPGDIILK